MIAIDLESEDNKFLARKKKMLLQNFRLTSGNQMHDAVHLATYLYASKRELEAENLLESYVYLTESDPERRDIWGANGEGILLLAYINRKRGNHEKRDSLVQRIIEDDIWSDRVSRAIYLEEELADYEDWINKNKTETHKYRCHGYAVTILTFIYFLEMYPTYENEVHESTLSTIEKIINDTTALLASEIG